ncbi:MAG: hypothetical protein HQL08_11655 [Nitrospirae bacterium]|nr:hypothetical protein [Nitrospirota bacterium]
MIELLYKKSLNNMTDQTKSKIQIRTEYFFIAALLAFLIAISFVYLLNPIEDPDFFWHIATGKWIAEHHTLPIKDPFSYTTAHLEDGRIKFFMTSYWLSQVCYYIFFLVGDYNGIILMRFVITAIMIFVLYKTGRSGEKTVLWSSIFLVMLIILKTYAVERPQVFTFILFAALIHQLDKLTSDSQVSRREAFILPSIMLLWSNTHAGYIVGQLTILLYMITEGLKFSHASLDPMGDGRYRKFLLIGGAGLLASFVNPNTYRGLIEYINLQTYTQTPIIEYESTFKAFLSAYAPQIPLFWLLLIFSAVIVSYKIYSRRVNITELSMLVIFGYFGVMTVRYIPFYLIIAVPLFSRFAGALSYKRIVSSAAFGVSVIVFILFMTMPGELNTLWNLRNLKSQKWVSVYYPAAAVGFIKGERLQGNMFNYYDWGGYLIWTLPEQKVFNDSRGFFRISHRRKLCRK